MIDSPATRARHHDWIRGALDRILSSLTIDDWPEALTVITEDGSRIPIAHTVARLAPDISRYALVDHTALVRAGRGMVDLTDVPDHVAEIDGQLPLGPAIPLPDPSSPDYPDAGDPPDHDDRMWGDDQ